MSTPSTDDLPDDGWISKSQRKREMQQLQELGEQLVALPESRLHQLDLPETLQRAILEAHRLSAREAIRRQLQYIGRIMREVDPAPIRARIEAWASPSRALVDHHHQLERWRERLLDEPHAVTELLQRYPAIDAQQLRTLIRNTRIERERARPPRAYRELFQMLKAHIPAPAPAAE